MGVSGALHIFQVGSSLTASRMSSTPAGNASLASTWTTWPSRKSKMALENPWFLDDFPSYRFLFIRDFPLPRLITRGYVWAALPCDCNPFWAVNNKETCSWSDRVFSSWLLPSFPEGISAFPWVPRNVVFCPKCEMISLPRIVSSCGLPTLSPIVQWTPRHAKTNCQFCRPQWVFIFDLYRYWIG